MLLYCIIQPQPINIIFSKPWYKIKTFSINRFGLRVLFLLFICFCCFATSPHRPHTVYGVFLSLSDAIFHFPVLSLFTCSIMRARIIHNERINVINNNAGNATLVNFVSIIHFSYLIVDFHKFRIA